MNHFSLFCKSVWFYFQHLSWRSDFMRHHHRFRDFFCKTNFFWYGYMGFLELHLQEPW